ncbi:MAG: hypothetical protein ABSC30_01645 [Acidimicrobiales bacterium]|jgi:hypothetical protein
MKAPGHPVLLSRDEDGAVLLLALVFIVVIAVVLSSLLTLTGNDLLNSSNLRTQRSVEYAADGAADAAVQAVRYSESAYMGAPQACLPNTPPAGPPTSITVGAPGSPGVQITVDCGNGARSRRSCLSRTVLPCVTRSVNVYACQGPGTCTVTSAHLQLQALVAFDDYSTTTNVLLCNRTSTATCGTGMAVESWVVRGSNS